MIREPSAAALPAPLRDLHPDAIAIGKKPFVVIEVVREGSQNAQRVNRLQQAAKAAEGWVLHLILDRAERKPELATVPIQSIATSLSSMPRLAEVDTRGALLLGWGSLEALARAIDPLTFARPQSPGRIIETLASRGVVTPSEAASLRKLASARNAVIHGNLGMQPTTVEIERFHKMLLRLSRLSSVKAH